MITVETISRDDLAVISNIEADLFETALTLSAIQSLFDGPAFAGHVSLENKKICGYVLTHRAKSHVEILSLGIKRTHQRRGHASQLLATLINSSRDFTFFLEAAADNIAALNLYKKNGFFEVGRRPKYYRRGRESFDAVVMRRC